jgi:Uri superfamily endonuclease
MSLSTFNFTESLDMMTDAGQLPNLPGVYVLQLHLAQPTRLVVGKLGAFHLRPGEYVYVGSARGPGGLRARLGRHIQGNGIPHWHIDALRRASQVSFFLCRVHAPADEPPAGIPLECCWSQALAAFPGAFIPIPGFGSSDCRHGCTAHLIGYKVSEVKWRDILQPGEFF